MSAAESTEKEKNWCSSYLCTGTNHVFWPGNL